MMDSSSTIYYMLIITRADDNYAANDCFKIILFILLSYDVLYHLQSCYSVGLNAIPVVSCASVSSAYPM
jgi:hypothetical protein